MNINKCHTTIINLNNVISETKLNKWYPLFRLNNNNETGYCGTYIISVNRNGTSGYPYSFTYILTIGNTNRITGTLLNNTIGDIGHNQMTQFRLRSAATYKYIEAYITDGGTATNTYYVQLNIMVQRQLSGISNYIQGYTDPEPLDDNIGGTVNWISKYIFVTNNIFVGLDNSIINEFTPIPQTYGPIAFDKYTNGHPYKLVFRPKDDNIVTQDLSLLFFTRNKIIYFYARVSTTNIWITYKLEDLCIGREVDSLQMDVSEDYKEITISNIESYDHITFIGINHSSAIMYKFYRTDV